MSTQGELSDLRVALVHDELTRRGGAEGVLEEMIRLFPQADVYALYAGRPQITVDGVTRKVQTSFLQQLPCWFRRHPSRLLPLLPFAAEQLDFADYDLVLSSTSGFAKAIVTRASVPHLCYCHTPTRYLWDEHGSVVSRLGRGRRSIGRALLHFLRLADYAAAQRVDRFIANSHWTSERIETFYRRPSDVVYPAVDTSFFTPDPAPRSQTDAPYFLCVGRLTPSKHFDQAIAVCEKLGLNLIIVGTGREEKPLRKLAGTHTTLVGKVDREQLRRYYRGARALLQPAEEDFGIASVEAQACGTPVIAYGVGGSRETIRDRETGLLYHQFGVEGLAEAIRQYIAIEHTFRRSVAQEQALRFSVGRFHRSMDTIIAQTIAGQNTSPYS